MMKTMINMDFCNRKSLQWVKIEHPKISKLEESSPSDAPAVKLGLKSKQYKKIRKLKLKLN